MKGEGGDSKAPAPRKMKFAPKVPPRKNKPNPSVAKTEPADMEINKELLAQFNAMQADGGRRMPKPESKAPQVHVAFGQGGTSYARSFRRLKNKHEDDSEPPEYVEPWDYNSIEYPTTLPLRRPYAGDPEILDEEEFGEAAQNKPLDEDSINPARELGLMDPSIEPQMIFFQFPKVLPLEKKEVTAGAATKASNNKPAPTAASNGNPAQRKPRPEACQLKDLPAGHMGKLLVYKSGKVKLKLGDVLFDVSPGEKAEFAQDVAVMNAAQKQCCIIGDLKKRAVVTPDIDSLLDSI